MRPILRTPLAMLALATLAIAGCQSPTNATTAPTSMAGDLEAVLTFGVGLDQRPGFRAFTLRGPWRVVIDVSHQPA